LEWKTDILGFGTSAFQIPGAQRGKDCCRLASRFSKSKKTKNIWRLREDLKPLIPFGHLDILEIGISRFIISGIPKIRRWGSWC
jgi:hypothetical protein